jgi:hypothetical protein
MPVLWELQNRLLVLTLIGSYDYDAPVRAVFQAMADSAFEWGSTLLIDARQSTVNRSSEEFRERAFWMKSLLAHGVAPRSAILINSHPHQFGMARMAATHVELRGLELAIFHDFDQAAAWLTRVPVASSNVMTTFWSPLGT